MRWTYVCIAALLRASAALRPRTLSLRALAARGGGAKAVKQKPVAKDFNIETDRSWVDKTINFLEAPMTELTIGTMAVTLAFVEVGREIQRLGVEGANWAVLFIAATRMLKAFLAVMRSTRMALRGYKSYAVVKRGETVVLRHIPASDDDVGT
mmetsp:Transcript_22061/g.66210  ORF Transcript_22061/g.66210 Transcript_22061/m.66210 type:complete len:153 (+) Transcript_22061:1458-1916(+)